MSLIFGTQGNDDLKGTNEDDIINGNSGDDVISGSGGADQLSGGEGNDYILTGDGLDTVDGGPGNDDINGYRNDTTTTAFTWYRFSGAKTINGGSGLDFLVGGSDADDIHGGDDSDIIYGREGADQLHGDGGHDVLNGDGGDDFLTGGEGNDYVHGGDGSDELVGGAGADFILGGEGNDILDAGSGNDDLFGGNGNDTLKDGAGFDILAGGAGDDIYYISSRRTVFFDTAGTDSAYVSADFVDLPSNIENVIYVNGALPIPYWIDALIYGSIYVIGASSRIKGKANFSFPEVLPSYDVDPVHLAGYTGMSSEQMVRVKKALQFVSSVIDMQFWQLGNPAAYDTLAFALNTQEKSGGYAAVPSPDFSGSDVYLNKDSNVSTLADGTYGTKILMHEVGHALGLKHPFEELDVSGERADPPYLTGTENTHKWTVMSYNADPALYILEYSPLDIAALQYLYGVNPNSRAGNDTYYFNENSGNFIWDGAGTDTIDASSSSLPVTIYLTPGHWGFKGAAKNEKITAAGQITVNFGTVIENIKGSSSNDTLIGNEFANVLTGGRGDDTLNGGAGVDSAIYSGSRSQYLISTDTNGLRVKDSAAFRDGSDTLQSIERIVFTDTKIAFDMNGSAGLTARVLGAVLGKAALNNTKFVAAGLSMLDEGGTQEALMAMALNARLGGNASSGDVVDLLFNNIVGVGPSVADRDYFAGLIDTGEVSRAQLGLLAANSVANEENINLIGLSSTGLIYS